MDDKNKDDINLNFDIYTKNNYYRDVSSKIDSLRSTANDEEKTNDVE